MKSFKVFYFEPGPNFVVSWSSNDIYRKIKLAIKLIGILPTSLFKRRRRRRRRRRQDQLTNRPACPVMMHGKRERERERIYNLACGGGNLESTCSSKLVLHILNMIFHHRWTWGCMTRGRGKTDIVYQKVRTITTTKRLFSWRIESDFLKIIRAAHNWGGGS